VKFTTKTAFTILLLAAFCAAQPKNNQAQNQHQTQQQNVGNTTTNSHNVTASGGAGGTADAAGGSATGGNASSAGGSATNGPQSNAQSTVENTNIPRQTFSAIAPPPFHTAPCIKGWGGAAQTGWAGLSLGAGKVDQGCDIRETAEEFRNAGSLVAFCKMLVTEPSAKKAGVSFADCMTIPAPVIVQPKPEPVLQAPPQIIVPPAQVTVNLPPPALATPALTPPPPAPVKHRSTKPTVDKNCPTLEK
jgi:hypothetical protein